MRIGVLSDTHISGARRPTAFAFGMAQRARDPLSDLEAALDVHLSAVDRYIHLGDFTCPGVAELIEKRAPLDAVQGNMDDEEICRRFPHEQILELEGHRIGLFHGFGPPRGIRDRVVAHFEPELDAYLFGHSHLPLCETRDGVLYLNPGSPTDRRNAAFHSMAVLEIGETLSARILEIR